MPVLFVGHGNPMNALLRNDYTRELGRLARLIPRPAAVLCVSAHWMTEGTWVTHMRRPKTIHDFYGFPEELFAIRYPAPGSPETAELVRATAAKYRLELDDDMWGLDHGAWSVLRHMYPAADVPVVQLSVYLGQPPSYHFELGRQLRPLRERGVLILGSGNVVHNLRLMQWDGKPQPYPWALQFDAYVAEKIAARRFDALLADPATMPGGVESVPTPDHWYPLLTALGAADETDRAVFEYEGIDNASVSMRCVSFGLKP